MAQVQLFQRTELPPRRVGQAKPGFDLAEGAELAQAGQVLAKFAGARFDKLVNSMAANEVAEFEGMVNTEIENFSTFVKSRPGATFEELETERNKMIQRLEAVSTKAVTEAGRQSIQNFMLRNKNLIFAKTQTNMEAIRARQAFDISESLIKQFETNFDEDGLRDHYESQIQAGLYNREVIFGRDDGGGKALTLEDAQKIEIQTGGGRFANQLAVMDDAAKELVADNASQIGLDAWAATVTPALPLGDKDAGFAAIQALEGLTGKELAAAESTYNTQVRNRRAESIARAERAEAESIEQINERLNQRNFTDIENFINSLPLTETQKTEQILKTTNFIKAVTAVKKDIATSDETNIAIDRNLNRIRKGEITYDEGLAAYSELAKGVNAKEGEQNLDDIRTAADAADANINPVLRRPIVVDGQASVDRIRATRVRFVNADTTLDDKERAVLIAEIEREVLADKTDLDRWAIENKDKPNFNQDFQNQVNAINRPKIEKVTLGFLQKMLRLSEETFLLGRGAKFLSTSEQAELARKRMKVFEEEAPDLFKGLTEEEKASALKRFRQGETVQDIIDRLTYGG